MKKICKNCKWWGEGEYKHGLCRIMTKMSDDAYEEHDDIISGNGYDCDESLFSGPNFGCIHWQEKPYPNVGV